MFDGCLVPIKRYTVCIPLTFSGACNVQINWDGDSRMGWQK